MKKAAEILARLLDKGAKGAEAYPSVFGGWQEIAGETLAEHSRIYEIHHRNLFVEVDHPGWMQLLLLKKPSILAKVQRQYPQLQIQDMKVRVNLSASAREPPREAARGQAERATAVEEAETPAVVRKALESVTDAGLREKLRRLLLSFAARRRGTKENEATD